MRNLPIRFVAGVQDQRAGYEVRERREDSTESLGFVWECSGPWKWVAVYPDTRRGYNRNVPGFATRTMAGLLLYRFKKPEFSGRKG